MNSTGSNTDPWGTPLNTNSQPDATLSITTLCLPDSQFPTHLTTPSIPYLAILVSNLLCDTLSNAFWKSKYPDLVLLCHLLRTEAHGMETEAEFNYRWRGCQLDFSVSSLIRAGWYQEEHPVTKTLFQYSQE